MLHAFSSSLYQSMTTQKNNQTTQESKNWFWEAVRDRTVRDHSEVFFTSSSALFHWRYNAYENVHDVQVENFLCNCEKDPVEEL